MAGHSKWAKVQHFEGAIDARRAGMFAMPRRGLAAAARADDAALTAAGRPLDQLEGRDDVRSVPANAVLPQAG